MKLPRIEPENGVPAGPETQRAYDGTRRIGAGLQYSDMLFAGVLIALAVFMWRAAFYGAQTADEAFYYTIPHKLFFGGRLLMDEWQFSQLSAVFQYLPFYVYHTVTGGTEGIVLFFRELYVAVELIFFTYIYASLRRYGAWGVMAAVVFVGYSAFGHTALNYYAMSNMALLLACFLLFVNRVHTVPGFVFTGFVFACCVFIEPVAALIYFAYTAAVIVKRLCRNKKTLFVNYGFVFDEKLWLWCTAGILICGCIAAVILFAGLEPGALLVSLKEMAGDSEYDFVNGHATLFKWHKIYMYLMIYGFVPAFLNLLYGVVLFVFRKRLYEKRAILFSVGCALYVVGVVFAVRGPFAEMGIRAVLARPVILGMFGFVCCIFTENKNRRIFVMLPVSFLYALLTDFTSEATVGFGCITAACVSVPLFAELWGELTAEIREKKEKKPALLRVYAVCAALALIALTVGESWNFVLVRTWHYIEDYTAAERMPLSAELTAGPLAGIKTTESVKAKYDAARSDLDIIRSHTDAAFYVADLCPWYYLYAELPYGTYSAYYVPEDAESRTLRWWELHPDSVPEYIYVPYFNCDDYEMNQDADEKLAFFDSICDYTLAEGQAGNVLAVTDWHFPQTFADPVQS